ncbi:phospholipase D-like domain-containing protein [Clostridium aestuarii]|uniref:phospholipase D n=1 Tax=Clostridium aestuarii TaxID=338193 RepID=A0ABT4CZQ4_9CLOT|nr:phospholipase D-like domain-containing protein [Clostridium aestuarii]MCY6484469.1 phospholipase D-like domain-containing protein [Clostridium aestuarii]
MNKVKFKKISTILFVIMFSILFYGCNAKKIVNNTKDIIDNIPSRQHIKNVSEEEGAINVYFNKSALTKYALQGNEANYNVNLEERLLMRINNAKKSIDMATYEINLSKIVEALIDKAADGLTIRVVADAKNVNGEYEERYDIMKLNIEKMIRGKDHIIGTKDDIHVICDSPMFAVTNKTLRKQFNLPDLNDISKKSIKIGKNLITGLMITEGEKKSGSIYYSPNDQMHNKFVIIDNKWVWTGSWNFTETGLYGSEENMNKGILDGNTQNSVEINSSKLAQVYKDEFNEMWGGSGINPNPEKADFHSRKKDNTIHKVDVNGTLVEVYFSPGDNAVGKLQQLVKKEANFRVYFDIFSWSDENIVSLLKNKWERTNGERTNFQLKGVFDSSFFYKNWSASQKMIKQYKNKPPIFKDKEKRKLHSKTMIIDANTSSDPVVVIGSTNWSNNGNKVNDENMLFIHNANIANQFLQEFYARYHQAGGVIPKEEKMIDNKAFSFYLKN